MTGPEYVNKMKRIGEQVTAVLDAHGMGHDRAVEMVRTGCEFNAGKGTWVANCGNCGETHFSQAEISFPCTLCNWEPKPDDGRGYNVHCLLAEIREQVRGLKLKANLSNKNGSLSQFQDAYNGAIDDVLALLKEVDG